MMELREKQQLLSELQEERKRNETDSSSRFANLNQVLLQSKQTCTQLEISNDELKQHEVELREEIKKLENKCSELAKKATAPSPECLVCLQRAKMDRETDAGTVVLPGPVLSLPGYSRVDELTAENTKLRQQYDCLLANFEMVSQKSSQIKLEAKESEKALVDLQAMYDSLQVEKEELAKRFAQAKHDLENTKHSSSAAREKQSLLHKDVSSLTQQLQSLQESYTRLEESNVTDTAKLKNQHDTIINLKMQVSSLQKEKSVSETELSTALSKLDSMQTQLVKQSESAASKHASTVDTEVVASYQQKLQEKDQEKTKIEEQLAELRDEMALTQDELAKLRTSRQELKRKSSRLEMQLKEAKQQSQKGSRDVESSKQENEALRQEIIKLLEAKESLESEKALLINRKEQNESQLNSSNKSLVKAQREVKHSWEMTKKLQREFEAQETQLLETTEQLQDKNDECLRKTRELEAVRADLNVANAAKTSLDNEITKLMTKIDELEVANFELDSRYAELRNSNASFYFSRQESSTKIEDLERKCSAQEGILLEKESQLNDMKISCALMEKENSRLISQLNLLSESLAASNAEAESLKSQLQNYEQETKEIAAMISELEDSHLQCRPVRENLEAQVVQLKDELTKMQDSVSMTDGSMATMKAEIIQLERHNTILEAMKTDIEGELRATVSEVENLRTLLREKDRQVYQVESSLQSMAASLKSKEEELQFAKMTTAEVQKEDKEEIERLELKLRNSQESCDSLLADKKQVSSRVVDLSTELEELKQINSCLEQEKISLVRQTDDEMSKVSDLRLQLDSIKLQLKDARQELKLAKQASLEVTSRNSALRKSHARLVAEVEQLKDKALNVLSDSTMEVPATPRGALHSMTNKPAAMAFSISEDQENIYPVDY